VLFRSFWNGMTLQKATNTITPGTMMLRIAAVLMALVALAIAQDNEQTCLADGTQCSCRDEHESCDYWQSLGECENNVNYMKLYCRASCRLCDPSQLDLGLSQVIDNSHKIEIDEIMAKARAHLEKVAADDFLSRTLPGCKNRNESCAIWAVLGECTKNPDFMKRNCAPVCESCDQVTIETRCPLDPNAPDAWAQGDLNRMFINITTLPENQKYDPKILSRPTIVDGDDEATIDYKIGPWVVVLENFVTDEECDHLIELGTAAGYQRSADVGKMKVDGTFEANVNDGRTSMNAWCQNECYDDPMAKEVMYRIGNLTGIPDENSEYLQLLQYEVGQYYRTHHDYIEHQVTRQQGVRLLTVFLYLNDVEAGGGTNFPALDITVMPKKGRALVWPSVKNEYPDEKDGRTTHQALKVEAGIKYGANAWLHQRDFKGPNKSGCQ